MPESISTSHVTLTASDSHTFDAYVARTKKTPEAAIVVIQEIFGVNHHIRSVVDDYASEGFFAIAPALFDRAERGIELKYDADGMARGRQLAQSLGVDKPLLDVAAAIEYASREVAPTAVGVVGFCWGGILAWLSATRLNPIAAVGYYGAVGRYAQEMPNCPVTLHFGELDKHIGPDQWEAVRSKHPEVAIFTNPDADHGFNCSERASYNPDASLLARSRTLEFLRSKLLTH